MNDHGQAMLLTPLLVGMLSTGCTVEEEAVEEDVTVGHDHGAPDMNSPTAKQYNDAESSEVGGEITNDK